jgi:uncharacterized protein (TIRG00374 family)
MTTDNQTANTFRAQLARGKLLEHRTLLQLGVVAVVVFLLIPHFVGFERVLRALRHANLTFIAFALVAEIVRYLASAESTRVLARMHKRDVPLSPLVQAFFGGAAANRTISTGGAPGMLVRLLCLKRYGVTTGGVMAIFLIENINGLLVSVPALVFGIYILMSSHAASRFVINVERALPLGAITVTVVCIYIYTRRDWVERVALLFGRAANRIARRVLHRAPFAPERVLKWINDFYAGVSDAQRSPIPLVISLAMNVVRYSAGMVSLYFTFLAVGFTPAPDIMVLMYTSMSFLTTLSAAPGEVAIMGSGMAILSLVSGVPQEIAVTALLLSRALAFWLPLPIGYAALWNMVRYGHL